MNKKKLFLASALGILASTGINAQNVTNDSNQKKENEKGIVKVYNAIENGFVSGYKSIENGFVSGYTKSQDKCVDILFKRKGETTEEAKVRLNTPAKAEVSKEIGYREINAEVKDRINNLPKVEVNKRNNF